MNAGLLTHWSTLGLLFASMALSLAIVSEVIAPAPVFDASAPANAIRAAATGDSTAAVPVRPLPSDVQIILERPLFNNNRLPITIVVEEQTPDNSAAHLSLEGVAIDGEKKVALIRDNRANVDYHVREGEQVGAWRLQRIDDTSAILTNGERTYELARKLR